MQAGRDPQHELSETDRGDDMQQRVRYQNAYAAMLALRLLDPGADLAAIYCEHHEDVLLVRQDATCWGVQVKTREPALGASRASDHEIAAALTRFVKLDRLYPGRFGRFVIAANCGFWAARANGANLHHVLAGARRWAGQQLAVVPPEASRVLQKLRRETGQADGAILRVLSQVRLEDGLPSLRDMNTRLAEHIAGIPDMAGLSFRQVLHVAQMLIDLTSRAAAHQCEPLLLDYRALLGDVEMESARAVIEGKRIDADRLRSLLEQERQPAALLRPVAPAAIRGLAAGSRVLELKAARGGFTSDNIDLLRDQKYAAESLFIGWLSKYDANRALALERYNHLLMLVRNECQEAYDAAQATAPGGGPRMLESVRRRLRERHAAGRDELFGCTYEHLLGVAGILTEECAVWWSEHFPIEEETGE